MSFGFVFEAWATSTIADWASANRGGNSPFHTLFVINFVLILVLRFPKTLKGGPVKLVDVVFAAILMNIASSQASAGATCESLASLSLPDSTITVAQTVAAGALRLPLPTALPFPRWSAMRSDPTTGWAAFRDIAFRSSPTFPFLGRRTEEYGLSDRQSTDAGDRTVDSRVVLVCTNDRLHHFWRRTC